MPFKQIVVLTKLKGLATSTKSSAQLAEDSQF
jgi:hypothetical protein